MKRGRKLCRFGAGMWAVVLMCGALVASAAAQRAVRADGPKPEGAAWRTCGVHGVAVQVLGSGGPELQDKRASSSYLVWKDGRAVALVDAGGGSALRFGESGAQMGELEVILFSHFHVDHSGDFAALIKSSWFEERKAELPIYGPEGNEFMPSTTEFVSDFFGEKRGAYRYLSELLSADEKSDYKMQPHNVAGELKPVEAFRGSDLVASAVKVKHGGVPALAWRVDVGGKSIVFSGDTNGEGGLVALAHGADLLIAHNAVPENAAGIERELHMPPSVIGEIAAEAQVKRVVLSHRMLRTLSREKETLAGISKKYSGPVEFGEDLECFEVK